jgi:hypothetical protein
MGGMMAATFLAIFFVPMFYRLLTDRKLAERRSASDLGTEAHPTTLSTEDGHA